MFADSVSEIFLLRVSTHVIEGKHRNRRFVGWSQWWSIGYPCLAQGGKKPISIHFPLVCELLFKFLDGKFGLYPEHFSGLNLSFLIPSC